MKYTRAALTLILTAVLAGPIMAKASKKTAPLPWDVKKLSQAPLTFPAPEFKSKDVQSLFFKGLPWQGKETRVFAWVGFPPHAPGAKLPGIVLVHGGGGTAFDYWVRLWNSRGYAAIAFDTYGGVPGGDPAQQTSHRHQWGGPSDAFQIEPPQDKWPYHGVANIMLANSLLRSYPQVDANRIGITGVSWGGYLTALAAGVDDRFRFAVPVYGSGFLRDDSAWLDIFKSMGEEKAGEWDRLWDPSHYLHRAKMPMLWVSGTSDAAFPLNSLQKTYRLLPPRQYTLCIRPHMEHSHHGGENPPEIQAFADAVLRKGTPLVRIVSQERHGNEVAVKFRSKNPVVRAELNFTKDSGPGLTRQWQTVPARLDLAKHRAVAVLPLSVTAYYFNLFDERGLIVSSEHIDSGAA